MKKFKSYKVLCLTLALGVALSGTILNAASLTKSLKAVYNNIAVSYNGQIKTLKDQPFIVDGTTYVPLRAIGEIMGATVGWANNTVSITASTLPTISAQQEIAAKNFEIASLRSQLDVVQKELELFKGTGTGGSNLTTAAIAATLKQITDEYASDYNVEWEFDLKLSSSRLELTVSYDSRYDSSDFAKTSESKRKQLIKEICYDIATLHSDTEIRGILKDSRTNKDISTFRYTKTGSYTYEENSSYSLSDYSLELEKYFKTIDIPTNTTIVKLPINEIVLTETRGNLIVNLKVNANSDSYKIAWNNMSSSSLRSYLKEIFDEVESEYNAYDSIVIVVRDSGIGLLAEYEDGRLDRPQSFQITPTNP